MLRLTLELEGLYPIQQLQATSGRPGRRQNRAALVLAVAIYNSYIHYTYLSICVYMYGLMDVRPLDSPLNPLGGGGKTEQYPWWYLLV